MKETIRIERPLLNPNGLVVTVEGGPPGLIEYAISKAAHKLTSLGYGDFELVDGHEFPKANQFVLIYEDGGGL